MAIVVVGANGYMGARLARAGARVASVIGTSVSPSPGQLGLDLSRPESFDYSAIGPNDLVYLAAAISSPDLCAADHDRAHAVNVRGTGEFIAQALARGARVVFFSSDTVYGHGDSEIDESSPPSPVGAYARMKYEVECRFLSNPAFRTLRLSYAFSREDKFTRYLLDCGRKGVTAQVFHRYVRAVVHLDDVVAAAVALDRKWERTGPVINVGGPAALAREEFADVVKELAAPALRYLVIEPPAGFLAERPGVIRMRSPQLHVLLDRPARSLRTAALLEFGPTHLQAAGPS
jgi:dTDP-4-dehydrorhamnose reductase